MTECPLSLLSLQIYYKYSLRTQLAAATPVKNILGKMNFLLTVFFPNLMDSLKVYACLSLPPYVTPVSHQYNYVMQGMIGQVCLKIQLNNLGTQLVIELLVNVNSCPEICQHMIP